MSAWNQYTWILAGGTQPDGTFLIPYQVRRRHKRTGGNTKRTGGNTRGQENLLQDRMTH